MTYRVLLPARRRALGALGALCACGMLAGPITPGPAAGLRMVSAMLAGSLPATGQTGLRAVATMGIRN